MCEHCEWEDYINQLEDMLADETYEYAEDTLQGIYDWVEENEHITDSQKQAIENIANKPSRRKL